MGLQAILRIALLAVAGAAVVSVSTNLYRDASDRPHLIYIEPQTAAPAEIVAAYGVNLERSRVAELLLKRGDSTTITHMVEQRADMIRFRVPAMLEPGEYRTVLLADKRWGTELIEQDILLTVVSLKEQSALSNHSSSASALPSALHLRQPQYR